MRYIHYILYIILSALLLLGCSDEIMENGTFTPSTGKYALSLSSLHLSFNGDTELSQRLEIKASNTPWRFSGMADWLTLDPQEGDASAIVVADAQTNPSGNEVRTSVFDFEATAGKTTFSRRVSATQACSTPRLTTSESSLLFSGGSSTQSIAVDANIEWEVQNDNDWIVATPSADKSRLDITVAENLTTNSRTATIFLNGNLVRAITITQKVPAFTPAIKTVNFENTGGTIPVVFTSEASWSVSTYASWISVTPPFGKAGEATLNITTSPNNTKNQRTEYIYCRTGQNTGLVLTVVQGGSYITPSTSSITQSARNGSADVTVNSNVEWRANCNADWIALTRLGDKITITMQENATGKQRTATITLAGILQPDVKSSIIVTQNAANVSVTDGTALNFDCDADSKTVSVTSEAAWTAVSHQEWIEFSPIAGSAGTNDVTVHVAPNGSKQDRWGTIDIMVGTSTMQTLSVSQKGRFITVAPQSTTIDSKQQDFEIVVTSNTSWQVLSHPEWTTVVSGTGSKSGKATFTVQANPLTTMRGDYVTIGQEGTDITAQAYIQQQGIVFEDLIGMLEFENMASTKPVTIHTDGHWTAKANDGWISVAPTSGEGTSELLVTVTDNLDDNERVGSVAVTVSNVTKNVVVTQKGRYFEVTPTDVEAIPSTGGSNKVQISTSQSWTAEVEDAWLTLSSTSGNGPIDVTITIADNPSVNSRTGHVTFRPEGLQPVRVEVVQASRYMRVDKSLVTSFGRGGSVDIIVETDASGVNVSTSESWITHDSSSSEIYRFTISPNTSGNKRQGKIIFSMLGLKQGKSFDLEVPVVQTSESNFSFEDFGADEDWNITPEKSVDVIITGFDNEENWN